MRLHEGADCFLLLFFLSFYMKYNLTITVNPEMRSSSKHNLNSTCSL